MVALINFLSQRLGGGARLRTLTLSLLASSLALAGACGGSGEGDRGGDGESGDGDGDVMATGGTGSGGAPQGDGDGDGSGGAETNAPIVPGTSLYNCEAPSGEIPALAFVEVLSGFDRSVLVTHAPNDIERLFVVEQDGEIQVVKNGVKNPAPFLNIEDVVRTDGGWEQGLLSLAFHPKYDQNGLFYVFFTAEDAHPDAQQADGVVMEYSVSADPDVANPASGRTVIVSDHPIDSGDEPYWGNHNGGTLAFGSDGYLYISIGDGGGYGDIFDHGKDPGTILGAISRIDPLAQGELPYTVPSGNLIESLAEAAPEVWDYGLRNPYRMNFDACTGDLYIGDVGQGCFEEIDIEPAGEGHHNYGWPETEGDSCYPPGDQCAHTTACDMTGLRMPFATFGTMGSAVTGGTVYRGSAIPSIRGRYFYGEHTGGRVFSITYDAGTDTASEPFDLTAQLGTAGWGISSIQNSGDGEIYLTTMDTLYRLAPQ